MTTLSEKLGVTKEIVGVGERVTTQKVVTTFEEREYKTDMSEMDKAAQTSHAGTAGDQHPSAFWQDTLVRTTDTPVIVRRPIFFWEAVKAVFSSKARFNTLVALEVEITKTETVLDDVESTR